MILTALITPAVASDAVSTENLTEGTFQCDWFSESLFYPYTYTDEWFCTDAYTYNHDIATFALELSMASFKAFDEEDCDGNIKKMYTECGFETCSYGYDTAEYDSIGVSFGKKAMDVNGESFTLIALAIRSGNYGLEWGGNMRVGNGETHEGFEISKNTAIGYFNDYLSKNPVSGRVKLLIPGYSRGASVANLLAASLDDESYKTQLGGEDNIAKLNVDRHDMYIYTFEAPQCTKSASASDAIYGNIFNVINPSDYVPKFPMTSWGFTVYGVKYYLPCAENTKNYDSYYERLCKTFDDMMDVNGKKSSSVFYSAEKTRSVNAMIDSVMTKIGEDDGIFKSQQYYAENYQDGVIFMAANYMSRTLGVRDILETFLVSAGATAMGILPSNIRTIRNEGYIKYISARIAESGAGHGLTQKDCEYLFEFLFGTLDFVRNNKYDFRGLAKQLKTILSVHQPYVELTWMKTISADDMYNANIRQQSDFSVMYDSLSVPYRATAAIALTGKYGSGVVKWSSDNENAVSVDENGVVTAVGKGSALITATLYDDIGNVITSSSSQVSVYMTFFQNILYTLKNFKF